MEHESLWAGSNTLTNTDPNAVPDPNAIIDPATQIADPNAIGTDPNIIPQQPRQCPHNEAFYADPNHEAVLAAQRAEMEQRALAMQAAAEAAAAAAAGN